MSIPFSVLHLSSLKLRQKLSIGAVLSLSVFMIAIAIARGVLAHVYDDYNQTWAIVWVLMEASVSIAMVSLMAFRELFLACSRSSAPLASPAGQAKKSMLRAPAKDSTDGDDDPMDTTIGMRAMVRDRGQATVGSFGDDREPLTHGNARWSGHTPVWFTRKARRDETNESFGPDLSRHS